jgi:3-deoxy-D-arabino-heptulosonate 7-phosphate (DAHP) synthase
MKTVSIGSLKIGGKSGGAGAFPIIAGPCSIEGTTHQSANRKFS